MSFKRSMKRRLKAGCAPAFFLGLVAYFSWNATQGAHGLRSYSDQLHLLARAEDGKAAAIAEQAAWTQRVSGLRDRALDADTLDERSRAMLNLADPNDIVVPYGANNRLY
ncbi:FtsB family cell division protein [Lichenicoccus roseus]|uniref:Septation inhibitor protein n=1 Tax=Lichenicoccus roseus TaxID=2683649 RepID=A0A5R9JBJ0_9PROT|nr:septation inhibitor protein [Lichenicoccus roseus]TLU73907.1 septation inhibitor protein [Lichenicoccus roseus]